MNKTNIKISIAILLGSLTLPILCFAQSTFNLGTLNLELNNHQDELMLVGSSDTTFNEAITATNKSNSDLNLSIYTTDAVLSGKNFIPNNEDSAALDLSTWINLPTDNLVLKPQESQTINVQVKFPPNAGIGQHLGAIMFKYENKDSQGNLVNIEKGIRVKANVKGKVVNKYQIINPQVNTTDRFITYSATIFNSGNTDLKGIINLTNQDGARDQNSQTTPIFLTPGDSKSINLAVEKPTFGQDTLLTKFDLANTTKTFILNEGFYWPDYLMPLVFILGFVILSGLYLKSRQQVTSKGEWKNSNVRKSLFVLALILASGFTAVNFPSIQSALIRSDIFTNIPDTGYLTTIKWGNFSKIAPKQIPITNWNGTLKVSSGRMLIVEKLHNEKNDLIYLNASETVLSFKNTTGPDNDGVIILFKPDSSDNNPTITYHNNLSGEEYVVPVTLSLKRAKYLDYKNAKVEIKTEVASKNVTLKTTNGNTTIQSANIAASPSTDVPIIEVASTTDNSEQIITDSQSTEDNQIDNTPTITPTQTNGPSNQQFQEELSTLREIIKDLPASSEVLSQYILNSDFVEQVTSENNSTTVKANSALIDKLKNAPLTIKEISASADQNFIFVPNEKVQLVPQQFSFDQKRISSQELGEIIFVQNKNSAWSTYLSVSDFVSVSGKGSIPASHVSITPGPINLISQTGIKADILSGDAHTMSGNGDQATLVNISPLGQGETIFSMKPQISIEVPAGTPPGTYRAEISIKEI